MTDEGFNPDFFPSAASSQQAFIKQYVPQDDDTGCVANFEMYSEYKPFKSKEAGREIFEDVLYIRINIRGDNKREVHRPASDADKRRFPFCWQEFQKGEAAAARGTPITKLAGIDPSIARAFQAQNVFTIEDLALVSDNNLQNLGAGAREMRAKAVEFVKSQQGMTAAQEENRQLRELVAKQSEDLAKAMALIERQNEEIAARSRQPQAKKSETTI